MKVNLYITLPLMLIGTTAFAQTISQEKALAKASSFLSSQQLARGINSEARLTLAHKSASQDETYYYVFNHQAGGFVIVGGDEAAQEILGYSDSGTFDYDKLPDNMKWFLSCYDQQISAAIKMVKEGRTTPAKAAPRKAPKANIDYLLKTKWDQVTPFNCMHPYNINVADLYDYDDHAVATGCVATAGAQIMKYHEWPDTGVGSHTDIYTFAGYTPSADFGATTYQWDKMKDMYDYCEYSGDEADIAVGTLMYHVGVAVDMQYKQILSGGSSADSKDLAIALANNFKYSQGITFHEREYYSDEQWEDMVYNELAASRPVLYAGMQESGSAHAFVCDGYQDGLYHINWGWSGSSNGNFLLTPTASSGTALCPDGSGSGGGEAGKGYYLSQRIGIGITPDRDGTSQPVKSAFSKGITLVTTSTSPGGDIIIDGYYCGNGSVVTQAYNLKMKFTNTDDEADVIIGSYIRPTGQITPGHAVGSDSPFEAPATLVPGQSYYVTLMYENCQGEYVDMPQPQTQEPQVLYVAAPDPDLEPKGIVLQDLFIDNGGYITMNSFNFRVKVKNNTSNDWTTTYLKCKIPFGSQIISVFSEPFKFYSREEAIVTFDIYNEYGLYFPYYFGIGDKITTCIEDYDGNEISEPITFEFRDERPIDYTLTAAEWGTLCLPYSAEVPAGLTAYTVTGTEGDMLVKENSATLEMNKPYLITGTPGTYPFNGPDTPEAEGLKNGLLVGNTTAAQTYAPQGSYVLQNLPAKGGLAFYEVENDGNQKVRQYGAYLNADSNSSAASFLRFVDDGESGIETVSVPGEATEAYNLNGMRLNGYAKGLVIVNGKITYNR